MLHVFVADDDELTRFGLRTLLSLTDGIEVVGEADHADRLMAGVQQSQPDLVLLDWDLRPCVDRSSLETIHQTASHPQIIALSTRPDQEQAALAAGAEAFVCKADPPGRLLTLVTELARAKEEAAVDGWRSAAGRDVS